ncbi:thiosulfate oxidation carrier protein SoxY [Chlorobium sp.]|jgi:sulfur-oxidizing protein SoxY|uniref:thiosulfate oxidation carrier protein SoxY n=1 Tax=Chlorobium sp. TaxID=1095 RepID=UPI003C372443|nr:thiosulfate-binding protein SoxY [Chlorobiaceae bacterium]NTW93102.1 thiosulfate-binding protein SoxY [Chlorobiaceae bacterium]
MKRRTFLERSSVAAALVLLRPSSLMAAWNEKHFQQVSIDKAFLDVLGTKDLVKSGSITIAAPPVASDSSAVPVEIISGIRGDQLYLFVERNVTPLVLSCALHGGAIPFLALTVKMRESSLLYAVIREGGKYHMASVHVDVAVQAC